MLANFLEKASVEEANEVDLEKYSFIRFSENRQCYIFKIREHKKKKETK